MGAAQAPTLPAWPTTGHAQAAARRHDTQQQAPAPLPCTHLQGPLQLRHLGHRLEVDSPGVARGRAHIQPHQLLQDVPHPQACMSVRRPARWALQHLAPPGSQPHVVAAGMKWGSGRTGKPRRPPAGLGVRGSPPRLAGGGSPCDFQLRVQGRSSGASISSKLLPYDWERSCSAQQPAGAGAQLLPPTCHALAGARPACCAGASTPRTLLPCTPSSARGSRSPIRRASCTLHRRPLGRR